MTSTTKWEKQLKELLIKQGALIGENDESGQQIYEEQRIFIQDLLTKAYKRGYRAREMYEKM